MRIASRRSQQPLAVSGTYQKAQPGTRSSSLDGRLAELTELSEQMGYSAIENVKLAKCLGHAISKRLRTRGENFVYQSAAFNVQNFPRAYAQQIFPASCIIENTMKVQTWRLESMKQVSMTFGFLLEMTTQMAAGCLRGEL